MMRRLRETLLWAGAALGVLAVLAGVAVTFYGFSFLVFRSGSMGPTITTGALALSRTVEAADIRPGDVVSVVSTTGDRVTHRVRLSTVRDGTASLVLRGDANLTSDEEVYQVRSAERVSVSVPYAGYVVAYALAPAGIVTVAAFCGMLVVIGFGGDERPGPPARRAPAPLRRSPGHGRRGRSRSRTRTARAPGGGTHRREDRRGRPSRVVLAAVLVLGLGGGAVTAGRVTGTLARFTDTATVLSGPLETGTVLPPTSVACRGSRPNAVISWTAPTGQVPAVTSYRVTYTSGGPTSTQVVSATSWRPPAGILLDGQSYNVTVASRVGSAWVSVQSVQVTIVVRVVLLVPDFGCS